MRRERCLITTRLAGPCARCRQAAWPAHLRGFEIYCEACCPACIPPSATAREGPRGRAGAGAVASAGRGKASEPPRPFRAILGPFWPCARHRAGRPARMPHTCRRCRRCRAGPPAGATTWPARTHCHAARHDAAAGGAWPRCRPPWPPARGLHTQVCAAHSAAKHFRITMFWRKLYD